MCSHRSGGQKSRIKVLARPSLQRFPGVEFLLAWSSGWGLVAFLGSRLIRTHLCLGDHVASSLGVSLIRTVSICFRVHLGYLELFYFKILNDLGKDRFAK